MDGGIDAARKEIYRPMNPDQLPDFVLPLKIIDQGYRVIYESDAILKEKSLQQTKDEYRMRVRVAQRAFSAINDMKELLNIRRFGVFSWQLWSHKVLRYLCFIFLILAFVSNFFIIKFHPIYKIFLIIQCSAYLIAIVSIFMEKYSVRVKPLYLLHYFVILNTAAAHAFLNFISGNR